MQKDDFDLQQIMAQVAGSNIDLNRSPKTSTTPSIPKPKMPVKKQAPTKPKQQTKPKEKAIKQAKKEDTVNDFTTTRIDKKVLFLIQLLQPNKSKSAIVNNILRNWLKQHQKQLQEHLKNLNTDI